MFLAAAARAPMMMANQQLLVSGSYLRRSRHPEMRW